MKLVNGFPEADGLAEPVYGTEIVDVVLVSDMDAIENHLFAVEDSASSGLVISGAAPTANDEMLEYRPCLIFDHLAVGRKNQPSSAPWASFRFYCLHGIDLHWLDESYPSEFWKSS